MRIGDAAAAVGATPRALRFYEQRGLLSPPRRTAAGQRDYGPDDLAVLRTVRDLLALGLTVEDLRGIADRLPLLTGRPPGCAPAEPGARGPESSEPRSWSGGSPRWTRTSNGSPGCGTR
ncbi:MerR family transcriptional regulator [Streptomyces sp. PsTaAH-124]|uniref:MerR family transcriptional regulator n=1 Tax=Streptomyces sp. PsTaAH-124 TaxID=1157638 RepID=UPI0003A3E1B4|nr:MerR family transcriptional regulator [Streptomyces sp. PsTaAH-124]